MQTEVTVNGYQFLREEIEKRGASSVHRLEKWTKRCEHPGCKEARTFFTHHNSAPLFAHPGFGVLYCARHRIREAITAGVPMADRHAILADAKAGAALEALALVYPYPAWAINAVLRERQSPSRMKLSQELAQEIRERHATGESCCALARAYGVHRNSVHRIVNGTTWV